MKTLVSTFAAADDARRAAQQLRAMGFGEARVNVLAPGASERALTAVPTDDGEAPGIGKAVGGVVGGAVGMAAAMPIGAVAASALIPGIGPIIAIGAIATAVLGLTGAAVGDALENALTEGVPKDDVFFIEDALRQGRTVVIVLAKDDTEADDARAVLSRAGAESLDAARDRWWRQLRATEEAAYAGQGGSFRNEESLYREGFECALAPDVRGQTGESLEAALHARHGDVCKERAFRAGFQRGREYDWRREDAQRLRRSA
jgi:hypothetical protein